MTNEEYLATQAHLMVIASMVANLDLGGFLNRIYLCESLAPIVDPTLWRDGHESLDEIKALAEAALPLHREAHRLKKAASAASSDAGEET